MYRFFSVGMAFTVLSPVMVDMFGVDRIARCTAVLHIFISTAILLAIPSAGTYEVNKFLQHIPVLLRITRGQWTLTLCLATPLDIHDMTTERLHKHYIIMNL